MFSVAVLMVSISKVFCTNEFKVIPHLSSIRFTVSHFMLRSCIHLEFYFVLGDKYESIWIPLSIVFQ